MSGIPQEIPDFGSAQLTPRQNPAFEPDARFTTEDYFVWSRIDGHVSLRDLILMVGLGTERSIEILRRLRRVGAVLLPGETPETVPRLAPAPPPPPPPPPPKAAPAPAPEPAPAPAPAPEPLADLGDEERAALAEDVQLSEVERRRIIEVRRLVVAGDLFGLLGVTPEVDARELKRAYFRVSKEFHPDRHFHQSLGSFGPWLAQIFETATSAYKLLSDPTRRAAFVAARGGARSPNAPATQGKPEHAAELFERACEAEVKGDPQGALRLFAAAIRVDGQPRYLRRAARCALACGQLSEAEEYAKKAAGLRSNDASYARVLADVYRAEHKLAEAEEILVRALELTSASDILVREIKADLAAVRAARAAV